MRKRRVQIATAWLALALAGCGGGGGGNGTSPGSSAGGGVVASGLVPAAPTVGATLYADARTLRPLQAGGVWNYRGTSTAAPGTTPVVYQTTTTQSGVSVSGATETTTNSGNHGLGSQTLSVAGGAVGNPQSIDFAGKGNTQAVNFLELRSPVRQGDQYSILDQHFTDTAIDADGDGKPDALDVAIYAQVAGTEMTTLPNLPTMQAVRVDTFILSRVTYSSNGQVSLVVQASLQTWYVAGIGIVRQTTSVPATAGVGGATTDEQITSWDGITTGLGAMTPVAGVIPTTSGVFPGQTLPVGVSAVAAFAFGDHALVFTTTPDFVTGTLASVVDMRGKVTKSTLLPQLNIASRRSAAALPSGVVYIETSDIGSNQGLALTHIDADGSLVGVVRGVALNTGNTHVSSYIGEVAVAADGETVWVFWARSYYDPGNGAVPGDELILQPFSLGGVALAPELVVDKVGSVSLQVAAANGQVLMSWSRNSQPHDAMFGSATLAGVGSLQALATGLPTAGVVTPMRLGSYGALMWPMPLGSVFSVGAAGGVLLDANLKPVRAGIALLDEQIAGLPPYTLISPKSLGSRIVITTTQSAILWSGDPNQQMVDSVDWLDVSGMPLANTPVNSIRFASSAANSHAVFADRVLVFGGNYGLTTTVVWLNKGPSQ